MGQKCYEEVQDYGYLSECNQTYLHLEHFSYLTLYQKAKLFSVVSTHRALE
jgi:ABC-type cobalamin transport system ATPase subunit